MKVGVDTFLIVMYIHSHAANELAARLFDSSGKETIDKYTVRNDCSIFVVYVKTKTRKFSS